jgi:hypothetical protein
LPNPGPPDAGFTNPNRARRGRRAYPAVRASPDSTYTRTDTRLFEKDGLRRVHIPKQAEQAPPGESGATLLRVRSGALSAALPKSNRPGYRHLCPVFTALSETTTITESYRNCPENTTVNVKTIRQSKDHTGTRPVTRASPVFGLRCSSRQRHIAQPHWRKIPGPVEMKRCYPA